MKHARVKCTNVTVLMSNAKEYTNVFGARIQWAMDQKGVSVEDMAEHFDVTVQSVYRWLRDEPRVNLDRLEQLSKYLGKPTWWWFAPKEMIENHPATQNGQRARVENLKGQAGGGSSIDPGEMPTSEAAKMLAGYFHFGERKIRTSIVFSAEGPPGDFGGYSPD